MPTLTTDLKIEVKGLDEFQQLVSRIRDYHKTLVDIANNQSPDTPAEHAQDCLDRWHPRKDSEPHP